MATPVQADTLTLRASAEFNKVSKAIVNINIVQQETKKTNNKWFYITVLK